MISQEQDAILFIIQCFSFESTINMCNLCTRQVKYLCEGCDYKDNIIINKDYYSLYMMFFIPYC